MEWESIGPFVPTDHARQVTAAHYIEHLAQLDRPPGRVLDLGCGVGTSLRQWQVAVPGIWWVGVDVGDSMEAEARPKLAAPVVMFDGVRVPLADGSFDAVYSRQVFEHVRHPDQLLAEVARLLAPGGWFAGSTSQLEPYHSRSYWGGYTIPGWVQLLRDAGLSPVELRPGIDAMTLIERSFLGRPDEYRPYFASESPLNRQIERWAEETKRGIGAVNNRKLRYSGQFSFLARRA